MAAETANDPEETGSSTPSPTEAADLSITAEGVSFHIEGEGAIDAAQDSIPMWIAVSPLILSPILFAALAGATLMGACIAAALCWAVSGVLAFVRRKRRPR